MSFVPTATAGGSMLSRGARPGMDAFGTPNQPQAQQQEYAMMAQNRPNIMAKPQALGGAGTNQQQREQYDTFIGGPENRPNLTMENRIDNRPMEMGVDMGMHSGPYRLSPEEVARLNYGAENAPPGQLGGMGKPQVMGPPQQGFAGPDPRISQPYSQQPGMPQQGYGQMGPGGPRGGPNLGNTNSQGASYQYTVGDAGPIQRDIQGADYYNEAAQKAYMDQARRTLDPQWQQTQADNETKLVNMGLSRGSEAWEREMANLNRNKNDAYQSAINAGILNAGAEGTRMQGMDLSQGNFRNAAQNQQYDQNFRNASMWNNAAAAQDATMLGNRAQDTGAFSAWNNANLGYLANDVNRFQAVNAADIANRGMVNQENRFNFDLARDMRFLPYQEQNLAMGNFAPTGSPTYSNFQTPGANGNAGGGTAPEMGRQTSLEHAGYGNLGGSILNTAANVYDRYGRLVQDGGYNGANGPGRFGDT